MPRRHLEAAIQRAVLEHLRLRGVDNIVYFAVPNGGKRNAREARNLKLSGVVAGIPDIVIIRRGLAHFLEIKTEIGRLSVAQSDMLIRLQRAGAIAAVVYGIDEAIQQLADWGLLR